MYGVHKKARPSIEYAFSEIIDLQVHATRLQ